jgi:enoyl-CoA hydratase
MIDLRRGPDGVLVLTLDDPDRRNAIGTAMRDELLAALDEIAADREARALVVRGTGTAFCSGADLPEVLGPPGRDAAALRHGLVELYQSFLGVRRLAIPTIAAVHGPAVGAGVNLALACDLRIFGPDGYLGITFSDLGIHPGGGCTWFLVQAVGPQRALEIILRSRRLDADECVQLGLALELADDPLDSALALARRIASLDRELVGDVLTTVAAATRLGFEDALTIEARAQADSFVRSPAVLRPRRSRTH